MGSPCELLVETRDANIAQQLTEIAAGEAWRIERKFSRYVSGNIVSVINTAQGTAVEVDAETAEILNFADTLHGLSDGAFDITSGVLRGCWTFDGSDRVPEAGAVSAILPLIGWQKVRWEPPVLQMPPEMEVDLGGIGKEFAVDRAVQLLRAAKAPPCLVNFGGDLAVTASPADKPAWLVGVESGDPPDLERVKSGRHLLVELRQGALATSGDARRYLLKDGKRYSHVLDPRTGWPVASAPRSVTVAADTCTQAGMLSTLAMLKGEGATAFLEKQREEYWITH